MEPGTSTSWHLFWRVEHRIQEVAEVHLGSHQEARECDMETIHIPIDQYKELEVGFIGFGNTTILDATEDDLKG